LTRVDVNEQIAAEISGLAVGSHVKLTIGDNGKGMDAETLEHAFDPFFTTKEVGQGIGLGLAVVHSIVSGHGGAIKVTSQIDRGTTVDIYFPLVDGDRLH